MEEGNILITEADSWRYDLAVKAIGDLDGTMYELLVLPENNLEYALVVDILEKTAYRFRINGYISPDYLWEKLIRDFPEWGLKDAENTKIVLDEALTVVKKRIAEQGE